MTDAAFDAPPPPTHARRGRPPMRAAPDPEPAQPKGRTSAFPWLSMDPEGDNPPPMDGKWLWLTSDGGPKEEGVAAYWKHTRFWNREANGGRGGWTQVGWWTYKFPPHNGVRIPFEPAGWWPKND